jgi:acyl-CoA synthetase (AMP-forming)/AMP-acid ligase II
MEHAPASPSRAHDFLGVIRRYWDRPAVISQSGKVTFGEIGQRAVGLAKRLQDAGVKPGDPVAVFLRNGPEAVWASFGVMLAGACETQLNSGLTSAERLHCLSLAKARLAVTGKKNDAELRECGCKVVAVEEIGSEDPWRFVPDALDSRLAARMNFTSGTTGLPKAIVTSHQRRWIGTLVLRGSLPYPPNKDSSILLVTPFSHGAGLFTQVYLGCGASVCLIDGMDMAFIETALQEGSIDSLFATPTVLAKLGQVFSGRKFSCLKSIYCGTAALSRDTYAKIRAIFGPIVAVTYGKTEIHSPIALLPAEDTDDLLTRENTSSQDACLGYLSPGVEAQIRTVEGDVCAFGDSGEIHLRAAHMANGWIDANGFHDWADDGFHATGDMGYFDQQGRLRLMGRSGDVIKTGGYKLYPAEVERALEKIGVTATVIGVPSVYWGQVLVAVSETEVEMTDLAKLHEHITTYKRPRALLRVESIPKNAQGKVVRSQLLELIQENFVFEDGPYPRFIAKG